MALFTYCAIHGTYELSDAIVRQDFTPTPCPHCSEPMVSRFHPTRGWLLTCPDRTINVTLPLPKGAQTAKIGCILCFCEEHGLPKPTLPASLPAVGSQASFNRLAVANLRDWKHSGGPRQWVDDHHGKWSHADWERLVSDLIGSRYWPMKMDKIGQTLENQKIRYWKKTAAR